MASFVRWLAVACVLCLAVGVARGAEDAARLEARMRALQEAGQFAEAIETARQLLALRIEQRGETHDDVAQTLGVLAALEFKDGRFQEAEPHLRQAADIYAKTRGENDPAVRDILNVLWLVLMKLNRPDEAEVVLKRATTITEHILGELDPSAPPPAPAPDPGEIATLTSESNALYKAGKYAEAAERARRALVIAKEVTGTEDSILSPAALMALAQALAGLGDYTTAEDHYLRARQVLESIPGIGALTIPVLMNNLAGLHMERGDYAKAERAYQESIAGFGAVEDTLSQAGALNGLATLYATVGRDAEAESLYRRALAIREEQLPANGPAIAAVMNNLVWLLQRQGDGRRPEALALSERALSLFMAAHPDDPEHPDIATAMTNHAVLLEESGKGPEAEDFARRALAAKRARLPAGSPAISASLSNLAAISERRQDFAEARELLDEAIGISSAALGEDHPDTALLRTNLARVLIRERRWPEALDVLALVERAVIVRSERLSLTELDRPVVGQSAGSGEPIRFWLGVMAKVMHEAGAADESARPALLAAAFQTAQRTQNPAAAVSIAEMAARGAAGDPALATLVRERQDLAAEWQKRDRDRTTWLARPAEARNRAAEAANDQRMAEIDGRLAAIDGQLRNAFPAYGELVNPSALTIEEAQGLLAADEALVVFLDTGELKPMAEETLVWIVTRTETRWLRSKLGSQALDREVAALRCGLDMPAWLGTGEARCRSLLGSDFTRRQALDNEPLPFDLERAHALYTSLLGEAGELIAGKHLLIVPSGSLTQLPFQVLLSQPPDPELSGPAAMRAAHWLVRDHAVTVLPSVASLKVLRSFGRASAATRSMIGFGNPILEGNEARASNPQQLRLRRRASRYRTSCALPQSAEETVLRLASQRLGEETLGTTSTIDEIRQWSPVPATGQLLCAIADDPAFEADGAVLLADEATRAHVLQLSAAGELAKYRIVHFATHGVLAGQVTGIDEPGLILTPPSVATADDTGYLSASDIAGLKLDAEWVILSACNTAAAGRSGGEALSGLARAFFFAQTRSLLVSHWSVYEEAAVALVADATRAAEGGGFGRAEALRQAMVRLIGDPSDAKVQPAYWAPFVIVGEGAPRNGTP